MRDDYLAFRVLFGCANCGAEFDEKYPAKVEVSRARVGGRTVVLNTTCDQMLHQCEDCCYNVQCPVCELFDHVFIDDREPLEPDE